MTDHVLTEGPLKRTPGRRLKGTSRWLHYHNTTGQPNSMDASTLGTNSRAELRLTGLARRTTASLAKERRLSSGVTSSPTLDKGGATPRTLRSMGTLKGAVRTSGALDSPVARDANLANDMWRCATVGAEAHRSFLRSLSGEGHDAKHVLEVCLYNIAVRGANVHIAY